MPPLNPYAPEWTPTGMRAQAGVVSRAGVDKLFDFSFDLASLPAEVITSVVSCLDNPRDVASCVCACKLLKRHVREAELCLDMRSQRIAGNGAHSEDILGNRAKVVVGLCDYMQGTVALLLPNVSLEDGDLDCLLGGLPRLQFLDLSGARKITQSGASALAHAAATATPRRSVAPGEAHEPGVVFPDGVSLAPEQAPKPSSEASPAGPSSANKAPTRRSVPLRFVNLQRCFQLHSGSLEELLAVPDLRCLALSHLDLGRWPGPASASSSASAAAHRGCELQTLALHNCLRLHGAAILALASVFGQRSSSQSDPFCDAVGGARFLLLGGSTLALASFVNSTTMPPPLPSRAAELLGSSYRPALTSTAATAQAHLLAAQYLVAAVLSMPRLVALELTFFPQPLVQCVRLVLADPEATGRSAVEVWDFAADAGDVAAAGRALRHALRVARPPGEGSIAAGYTQDQPASAMGLSSHSGEMLDELAVATVLRCAVNCSSVTRSTPLHIAAERGNAAGVAGLLAAGAVVDARDTAGSTALFLASEAGHTAVLERLLGAGADPTQSNAAGETPLYIAALRGHLGCVKELLAHCNARGIAWQDPDLYGDAWTPLHAAAVANRADVAAYLLQAAGTSGAGELVLAPNKYGQSVLHVAARKGSSQLLRLLLSAGGVAVVGSRDGSGDTPVDVAKKNRHVAALAEFRRLTAMHSRTSAQQSAATAMA